MSTLYEDFSYVRISFVVKYERRRSYFIESVLKELELELDLCNDKRSSCTVKVSFTCVRVSVEWANENTKTNWWHEITFFSKCMEVPFYYVSFPVIFFFVFSVPCSTIAISHRPSASPTPWTPLAPTRPTCKLSPLTCVVSLFVVKCAFLPSSSVKHIYVL